MGVPMDQSKLKDSYAEKLCAMIMIGSFFEGAGQKNNLPLKVAFSD